MPQAHIANYSDSRTRLVLGLISGTSADGVDVAAVRFPPADHDSRLELLHFETVPYPQELKERVLEASQDHLSLRQTAVLHTELGEFFAQVAKRALPSAGCDLIGSHGQTVCHLPDLRTTMQLGDGSIIANRTGVTTVSDFRTADMSLGGQGAPLVPLFDAFLLADPKRYRIAVNLGGIANITAIAPAGLGVVAWDTGPANCISDALCRLHGLGDFDPDGALAAEGSVDSKRLIKLLQEPYFSLSPPKSTGLEDFGRDFAERHFAGGELADLLRTSLVLSAQSLVDSILLALENAPNTEIDIVFAGGGTSNLTLMEEIEERLVGDLRAAGRQRPKIESFADYGVPEDAREAVAFAYLADRTARGLAGSVPGTTGVSRAAVLGKISLPS